jgi:hypothetical protein
MSNKWFLLDACISPSGLNDSADEIRVFAAYRQTSDRVKALMAANGIKP